MRRRRHGTRAEVVQTTRRLVQVVEVTQPYPDRGPRALVRVGLEVRLAAAAAPSASGPPSPTRRPRS
jgi:hypothetical protein